MEFIGHLVVDYVRLSANKEAVKFYYRISKLGSSLKSTIKLLDRQISIADKTATDRQLEC